MLLLLVLIHQPPKTPPVAYCQPYHLFYHYPSRSRSYLFPVILATIEISSSVKLEFLISLTALSLFLRAKYPDYRFCHVLQPPFEFSTKVLYPFTFFIFAKVIFRWLLILILKSMLTQSLI